MKQIRESRFSKIVAYYLMIMMFLQVTQPVQMYALTSGPTQPEFNSFTPIGTSDMVDLTSGDFNYNIPIMDVGGYPLNLSYDSGVTMDQEASWVGLGWNMNVGQIERQVRGLPDDFNGNGANGDKITYDNDLKENRTVGMNLGVNLAVFGFDGLNLGVGLGVESNNYEGISFKPSFGIGFELNDNVSVGMNFASSLDGGATVTPSMSLSAQGEKQKDGSVNSLNSSVSLGFNSRKGVENLNLSASVSKLKDAYKKIDKDTKKEVGKYLSNDVLNEGVGGSISFNDQSFTPSKRIGFENKNFSFNGALGGEVFGVEGQVQVTGYGSYQRIRQEYKHKLERAYGYENTEYRGLKTGVLDFNRENEKTVNEHTTSLPLTNYTYDLYNIEGQGVSGMFRPYRSQVGNVYNDFVIDQGASNNFGIEIGLGNLVHGSGDFKMAPSTSWTGPWSGGNNVLPYLTEKDTDKNTLDYEPYAFKMVGSMNADPLDNNMLHKNKALRIGIQGGNKNSAAIPHYYGSDQSDNLMGKIKRTKRFARSQVIQKVSNKEATQYQDRFITNNENAKPQHTAGLKVLKTDGSTYVYGVSAYSTKKVEATFDVSKNSAATGNNTTGLVSYTGTNGIIGGNNTKYSDMFLNKITTPAYAHSFMLSSVLSADYEDVDDNGPTMNDLGSFTSFEYKTVPKISGQNYKWRVPFGANEATYNEGIISNKHDQKGNYIYGEKELVYLDKIVTKTHVAFFDLEDRKDAIGVANEEGGAGVGRMKKIRSIRLYSRPEATDSSGNIIDPQNIAGNAVKPIKTAHFIYSYNLCKNVPNNSSSQILTQNELNNAGGKLTLERVYFTYRGSNMGKYTPYIFNYNTSNPVYDAKGFDIWGNFKENPGSSGNSADDASPLSNTEFPYVDQKDKATADYNVASWSLKTVRLPSGGEISIETETDDYRYVQNKKAMQMFKVIGAGYSADINKDDINEKTLYNGNAHKKFIYVKLDDNDILSPLASEEERRAWFIQNYLKENYSKPIQYRFLLNMRDSDQYDYVSGYFQIGEKIGDKDNPADIRIKVEYDNNYGTIAAIPLSFLNRDGGTNGSAKVNPIAKSGWSFGRTYLNRIVYGLNDDPTKTDFSSIVKSLKGSIEAIKGIFTGPNKELQSKGCARFFKEKSWIRLENPDGRKLGGGLRVKTIKLSDNWSSMLSQNGGTNVSNMEYGQTYSYEDENNKSTGVATFEPNSCAENPLVEPFYPTTGSYAENIAAPRENNYTEKPFGANFFPAPRVTYSKVTVKNINSTPSESGKIIKKHATGKIVTEHYTAYDFPTRVDHTNLNMINDLVPNNIIGSLIKLGNIRVRNHLTMSQGYSVETNDMNGKLKKQTVYDEGDSKISSVEYKYSVDDKGRLDNNVTTIDPKGKVEKKVLGLDYDMINDFNESYSGTTTTGFDFNTASFLVAIFPIFVPITFPKQSYNENKLRTVVTTKHIHKTGILTETIATDLGATVSTKNLAWDANSGGVILTGTVNEYGNPYYSFSYPAYWMYQGMGPASDNLGIKGVLKRVNECDFDPKPYFKVMNPESLNNTLANISAYFHVGDELMLQEKGTNANFDRVWVVGLNNAKTGLLLMDRDGNYIDNCGENTKAYSFKVVRSGYRNLQSATMASITSMINPLKNNDADPEPDILDQNSFIFNSSSAFNPRIINASAVVYKDFWKPQGDTPFLYPTLPGLMPEDSGEVLHPFNVNYNPYLWNTKGDWKAEKSYAYLSGRKSGTAQINNPRNEGFFTSFVPFYQLVSNEWTIVSTNWTYASSVTQFSPFGMELENKDALNRYSAAQYGYQNKLPMAVASNAKYNEIGFEGFEETQNNPAKHFLFNGLNNGTPVPVTIAYNEWHTGKRSVKVTTSSPVKMVRKLKPAVTTAQVRACEYRCDKITSRVQVATNITNATCEAIGDAAYYKFKISPQCVDLKITGQNGITSLSTDYEFSSVPDDPNSIYLTIYGHINHDDLQGNPAVVPQFLIPIQVDGVNMNLLYIYPIFLDPHRQDHCYQEGHLTCP